MTPARRAFGIAFVILATALIVYLAYLTITDPPHMAGPESENRQCLPLSS